MTLEKEILEEKKPIDTEMCEEVGCADCYAYWFCPCNQCLEESE
jgi:hypothetical protein